MSQRAKATRSAPLGVRPRGQGVIKERIHDPYRDERKPAEPAMCPQCGLFFHEGRWQSLARLPNGRAHETLCPACRRIRDDYPAGYVTLEGPFFREHRTEIIERVTHRAAQAAAEHPLQRVMAVSDRDGGVLITTTDMHLARGIGEAVHDAFQGTLHFRYEEGQQRLRVHWQR